MDDSISPTQHGADLAAMFAGRRPDAEMPAVLRHMQDADPKPIETLDPTEAASLRALAGDAGSGTPYREGPAPPPHADAPRDLADLLERYERGDFGARP